MNIYGISFGADVVIVDENTIRKGYIGWWSCSNPVNMQVRCSHTRTNYLDAISDAVQSAKSYSRDNNIAFISDGGKV